MSREIANTIQKQMIATVGMNTIWSWGKHGEQFLTDENLESLGIKGLGALKFKVNGHHHKGHVLVVLNGSDYYDVYICHVRAGKIRIVDSVKDRFFDEFAEWIDEKVERIESYVA